MRLLLLVVAVDLCLGLSPPARGSIAVNYQFIGRGNWSIDGIGSNQDPVGDISFVVPNQSTIVRAILYSTKAGNLTSLPNIQLDTTVYSPGAWTPLGVGTNPNLQAYRTDVTNQVNAVYSANKTLGVYNMSVRELTDNGATNGELLAVIFSNPSEQLRTIALLDGFASSTGDITTVNFDGPLDMTIPGFESLLSLGIGHSFQDPPAVQFSTVDVVTGGSTRRLTSGAGNYDDGDAVNGGLITAGGIGDSAANPDPILNSGDDELYDLAQGNSLNSSPFLQQNLTSFELATVNQSNDDLIFFLGLNVTARASVNKAIPEPSSLVIWVTLGAVAVRRMRR